LATANGQGAYNASADGNYTAGALSWSTFTLSGNSSGNASLTSSGAVGTTSYSHDETWSESNSLSASGSYGGGSSGSGGSMSYAAPAWNFSSYTSTTVLSDSLHDAVGIDSDSATINDTTTTVGTGGTTGTTTETASGNYTWDLRSYSFASASNSWTVTLSGGGPSNVIYPNLALQNWGGPTGIGSLVWTPGASLTATAGKLAVSSGGVLLGGSSVLVAPLPGLLLAGIAAPMTLMWLRAPLGVLGYGLGGWIGPQANGLLNANLGLHPWNYLNSQHETPAGKRQRTGF
jgi:hypothetical protein